MMTNPRFEIDGIRVRPPVEETPEDIRAQLRYEHRVVAIAAAAMLLMFFARLAFAATTTVEYVAPSQMSSPSPHESSPSSVIHASVSAYTSSVDETDDTPEINAAGETPGPGSIACPVRIPLGTKVSIGGKIYTCDDRMGGRFARGDYFDVWMQSKDEAINFGRQELSVRVLE